MDKKRKVERDWGPESNGPLRIEYVDLAALVRWPRNPKQHDLGTLHQSFKRFGYVAPILVDEGTGKIVAGHGRLDALQQAQASGEQPPERIQAKNGRWFVPVIRGVDFASEMDAEAYLIADNQLTVLGGWDDNALAEVLADLVKQDGLEGIGYDAEDVDALLRQVNGVPKEVQKKGVATCPQCGYEIGGK